MWHRTTEGVSLAPPHVVEQQKKTERSHPRVTTLGEDVFFLFHLFLFLWMSELISSLGWLWLTSVMHMLFSLPLSSHPKDGWMTYMPEAYWELERAWKCPFWLYFNIFARSRCWVEPGKYSHRKTIKKIAWTILIWFFFLVWICLPYLSNVYFRDPEIISFFLELSNENVPLAFLVEAKQVGKKNFITP